VIVITEFKGLFTCMNFEYIEIPLSITLPELMSCAFCNDCGTQGVFWNKLASHDDISGDSMDAV
jgi:hypothetical protein